MKKLNVLVIGAGMYVAGRGTKGVGTVLPSLYNLYTYGVIDQVHIVATSPASAEDAQQRAEQLSRLMHIKVPLHVAPRKEDPQAYQQLLKQHSFDCAIIVVPDHLHSPIACDVIQAGVHVLMVKPLAPTVQEASRMVTLAQEKNLLCQVEFHKRYDEANLKLKDEIERGRLGDISYISVGYSQRKSIPVETFKSWIKHTDIFQYLGVHYVDLIYFVTGARPLRAMATGQKNWLAGQGLNTYDAIQAMVEWQSANGKTFVSSILTNWIDPDRTSAMSDQKITVVGTKGRYESDQKNRGVQIVTDEGGVEDFNPYFSQLYPDGSGKYVFQGYGEKSIRMFLMDVLHVQVGSKQPSYFEGIRPTFKEGLVSTAVIEAVRTSLENGNVWVGVK